MGPLTLRECRVQNFWNVDDSGWIPVEQVTTLLGRNESGKTALLKALHKFNPATPQPYDPQRDFPRERYASYFRNPSDWPATSCRFAIGEELRATLAEIVLPQEAPRFVTATRYYDQALRFEFDPPLQDVDVGPAEILQPLENLAEAVMSLSPPAPDQEEAFAALRKDLLEWVAESVAALGRLSSLNGPVGLDLLHRIQREAMGRGRPETKAAIRAFLEAIAGPIRNAARPALLERLGQEIEKRLPVFIYFDNHGVLDSAVYLPRLLQDLERSPDETGVRTIDAMFKHVGLTAREIADLGHSQAREIRIRGDQESSEAIRQDQERATLRSIKLGSASADITRKFSAWWTQGNPVIRYHADGDFFRIWVADDRRPIVEMELERRGQGFQWFFSFYLVFSGESDDMHKEAVLLLDSPGLHLHPTAQQELMALLEQLSTKNQLIYATHSPFLIDGEHLHRVRPLTRDDAGRFHVCLGEWPDDRETIFPLQAAAGYSMIRGLFEHRRNILVKDISDYFYLSTLSQLCRRSGRTALPEDANITPCDGTLMVAKIAALFLGQPLRPVILLDGGQTARAVRDKLVRELYLGQDRQIVMLDAVLGKPDCRIEDLIGEIAVLGALEKILGKSLLVLPADRAAGGVVEHIAAAAMRLGIALPEDWIGEMARQIAREWAIRDPREVPAGVLDRAANLFGALNARFEAAAEGAAGERGDRLVVADFAKAS
jgi:energy-coupling factor transporter ATP-binding protein EcfA2